MCFVCWIGLVSIRGGIFVLSYFSNILFYFFWIFLIVYYYRSLLLWFPLSCWVRWLGYYWDLSESSCLFELFFVVFCSSRYFVSLVLLLLFGFHSTVCLLFSLQMIKFFILFVCFFCFFWWYLACGCIFLVGSWKFSFWFYIDVLYFYLCFLLSSTPTFNIVIYFVFSFFFSLYLLFLVSDDIVYLFVVTMLLGILVVGILSTNMF